MDDGHILRVEGRGQIEQAPNSKHHEPEKFQTSTFKH
jgi:hypothetical protein